MASLTAYAVGDGHIDVQNASWATARAASSGTATDDDTTGAWLCETAFNVHAASQYNIRRAFFSFDTSGMGAGAVPSAATFKVYVSASYQVGSLCLVAGSQASTSGLVGADFDNIGSTELASRIDLTLLPVGYATFTLNAAGLAALNASGYTKFAVLHSADLDNSPPGNGIYGGALCSYSEATGTSNDPVLDVTYSTTVAKSASDSGTATEGSGSVDTGVAAKTASDSGTATDASSARALVGSTNSTAGTPKTRTAAGSVIRVFAADAAGFFGAHYAFPTAVKTNAGTVLAFARKATTHGTYDGDLVMKSSSDDGATWGTETTIVNTAYDERDPMVRKLASGRIVLTWQQRRSGTNELYYARFMYSDDHGATWSTPITITSGFGADCSIGSDICELANGDLLAIMYGCPGYWDQTTSNIRISRSTDGGATWAAYSQVVTPAFSGYGCLEPQLRLLSDGVTLICTFHTADSAQTHYWTKSTNGGSSWTTPTSILATGNRAGLLTHPADQDLIFCYTSGTTAYLKTSTDNAATFGAALSLGTGNSGYIGGVWCSPFALATTSTDPDLGVMFAFETASQLQSEVYFRAVNAAMTPGVALGTDSATGADTGSVTVGVGAIAKTASDAATSTDTASGVTVTFVATLSASDQGYGNEMVSIGTVDVLPTPPPAATTTTVPVGDVLADRVLVEVSE